MDRKTVLAFVLIGVVILSMPYYFKLTSPEAPPEEAGEQQPVMQDAEPVTGAYNDTSTPPPATLGEQPDVAFQESGSHLTGDSDLERAEEQLIRVTTPLYDAEFSTRGATVRSWRILPSQSYLKEYEQLVRYEYSADNLTLTALGGMGLLRTRDRVFSVEGDDIELYEGDAPESLVFTLSLGEGRFYRETYVFHPDKYEVDVHLESVGLGATTGAISASYGWGGAMAPTEADTTQDLYYTESSYFIGSSKETLKSKGKDEEDMKASGATKWVAQRTKYFVMALVPDDPAEGAELRTWPDVNYDGKYRPKLFETNLVFNIPQGDLNEHLTFYLGPLDQDKITAVEPTLVNVISWGWPVISTFSKGIFYLLKFLHQYIPNYGVVLILFSLLVKLVVWPLTYKSHKSMKRMQVIQPILKDTQARFKDDPQRMQKEVMALYKEHKVNPMGGCWPTLLQMPLLFALFIVFRSTIELRGQPFVLWINDLSMPDVLIDLPFTLPLYGGHIALLPILFAVTSWLQSRQTMTDPNQKMMVYMMPIMMLLIFNNFPSGLTLYYTLFNLLTWGQQRIMKTSDPELERLLAERKIEQEKEHEREERRRRKKQRK